MVFSGRRTSWGPGDSPAAARAMAPAEEVCCRYMNLFAGYASAAAWASGHPEVTGQVLGQVDALRLGMAIFGHLLTDRC